MAPPNLLRMPGVFPLRMRVNPRYAMKINFGGPYFLLPRSAIDTVQSGTLPYGILNAIIERGRNNTGSSLSSTDIIYAFCAWFTPTFVVLTGLVLTTIVIPISGCGFLCLWRCGHCFARKHESLLSHHGCKCLFSVLIFTLSIISLLIGIFFGLISNMQLSISLTNLITNANITFANGFEFALNTVNEVDASLIDGYHVALSSVTTELANASELFVMPVLDRISPAFSSLLSNGTQLLDYLDAVHIDVLAINQSITALRNHALQINSTLLSLLEASDNFTAACNSDFICEEAIPDVPFFCGLDEVENPVEYSSAFNNVDLNDTRVQLSDQHEILENITRIASDLFNMTELPFDNNTLSPVSSTLESIRNYLDRVQGVDGNLQNYLSLTDSYIKRYEVYRNLAGYILFLFFGVLLAPFLCGLISGVLGFRCQRSPAHRTVASHSGALIIMIGVGASFSFSGFFLIISSVLYTLSTLFQKVCNDLAPPHYVLFSNIIDNRTLWDGSTLLGTLFSGGIHNPVDLRIGQVLTDCSNNAPLYQAIKESMLFNFSELTSAFNFPEIPAYNFAPLVDEAIDEILPNATRMDLQLLPNTIGDATHLSTYRSTLAQPILNSSLDTYMSDLTDLVLIFHYMNMSDQAVYVEHVRNTLVDELNTSTRSFDIERNDLWIQLTELEITLLDTKQEIENFMMSFDTFHDQATSSLSESYVPYIESLFSHFIDYGEQVSKAVRDDIGRCQPVTEAYRNLHVAVCKNFLDGINGLWCSILWCVCACLSLIITGTIITIFLRRSKCSFGAQGSEYGNLSGKHRVLSGDKWSQHKVLESDVFSHPQPQDNSNQVEQPQDNSNQVEQPQDNSNQVEQPQDNSNQVERPQVEWPQNNSNQVEHTQSHHSRLQEHYLLADPLISQATTPTEYVSFGFSNSLGKSTEDSADYHHPASMDTTQSPEH